MDFSFEKVRTVFNPTLCVTSYLLLTVPVKLVWSSLQTHSAYMLFYKRVELEEENGKDFSFDVSPDLLEVFLLSLSYLRYNSTSNPSNVFVSLPVDLARQHAVPPGQEHI